MQVRGHACCADVMLPPEMLRCDRRRCGLQATGVRALRDCMLCECGQPTVMQRLWNQCVCLNDLWCASEMSAVLMRYCFCGCCDAMYVSVIWCAQEKRVLR